MESRASNPRLGSTVSCCVSMCNRFASFTTRQEYAYISYSNSSLLLLFLIFSLTAAGNRTAGLLLLVAGLDLDVRMNKHVAKPRIDQSQCRRPPPHIQQHPLDGSSCPVAELFSLVTTNDNTSPQLSVDPPIWILHLSFVSREQGSSTSLATFAILI